MGADRRIIYAAAFLRALATGMAGTILGLYLKALDIDAAKSGYIVSAGLAGVTAAALLVTLVGDRLGRKTTLITLAILGAVGAVGAAYGKDTIALGLAAFAGMINGMGRDRGASLILEQSILPGTTTDAGRTKTFAWYNILQDAGHAVGALLAALPQELHERAHLEMLPSFRVSLGVYGILILASGFVYLAVSPAVEAPPNREIIAISPATRKMLWKISALFFMDSLGGGFLTNALLTFFFVDRFEVTGRAIGLLFFGARVLNAVSHMGAAWLSKKIGLVNTMVFTHIPSSVLLFTVPFAPTFWIAAVLFLIREGLVEMDVPTRQSYLMAVVAEHERTVASGVTTIVRMSAWATGPFIAGELMTRLAQAAPLYVGAGLKIVYDMLLYFACRGVKPPEEARP